MHYLVVGITFAGARVALSDPLPAWKARLRAWRLSHFLEDYERIGIEPYHIRGRLREAPPPRAKRPSPPPNPNKPPCKVCGAPSVRRWLCSACAISGGKKNG